jgi:hypothetical protein
MKKEAEKLVCIHRNTEHEETTKRELETARLLMQGLVDEWGKLQIGECTDLNELQMSPERLFKTTIDKMIEVPATQGRFAIDKEKYKEGLKLPDPAPLYAMAKATRQQSYCAVPDLFEIAKGNIVVLNKEVSDFYIEMQNIYISDPTKIQLAEDLNKLCELYNSLNVRLNGTLLMGSPWAFNFFRGSFILRQKSNNGLYEIALEPAFLRSALSL